MLNTLEDPLDILDSLGWVGVGVRGVCVCSNPSKPQHLSGIQNPGCGGLTFFMSHHDVHVLLISAAPQKDPPYPFQVLHPWVPFISTVDTSSGSSRGSSNKTTFPGSTRVPEGPWAPFREVSLNPIKILILYDSQSKKQGGRGLNTNYPAWWDMATSPPFADTKLHNRDAVLNTWRTCGWFLSVPPAPHIRGTRCAGQTNCLFRRTAVNLIRPQTLMPRLPSGT